MARTINMLALGLVAGLFAASPASADTLSTKEIRETVSGQRIYLATPFGGEFPLNYRTNGRVDGSGEALGLGRIMQPKDSGRWWIENDRLCQQWREWYDGRPHCFVLSRAGEAKLRWVRDDGLAGTARIAR